MNSGVYGIFNKINGKVYVGSSINLDKRKGDHFRGFEKGEAINQHLKYAILKYGIENFEFVILEYCEDLLEREQYYWEVHKNHCYNCYKPSLDSRELSRILSGKTFDKEHRDNLSKARKKLISEKGHPFKNKKHKESSKLKMSLSAKKRGRNTGKWTTEDVKEIRQRFMSGEMIMKISKSLGANRKNISAICNCKSYLEEEAFPAGYKAWFEKVLLAREKGERPTKRGWSHSKDFKEKFRKAVSKPNYHQRKLSDNQVQEILSRLVKGERGSHLAREYNVSPQLISKIKKNNGR